MCSSKPKIPNNQTPPVPNAPEPTPDAPTISERGLFMRGRGLKIAPKPDLSGLGNQQMGTPTLANTLRIGAGTSTIQTQEQINQNAADAEAYRAVAQAGQRRHRGGGLTDARKGAR